MSKGNITENDIMQFIFNGVAMPSYGANLICHLHTSDPGEAGVGSSNEADYTGYAAVSVARDSSGFTVAGNQAINTAEVVFPECTGGANILTHGSISTVGGQLLYMGALQAPLSISNLITPRFPAGTLVFLEE